MRPSDVLIRADFPLPDTFGRVEREVAAAILVVTCRAWHDAFVPVDAREIRLACIAFSKVYRWLHNPFYRPDFDSLIELGFATVDDHGRLSFTEAGLGCLRGRVGR